MLNRFKSAAINNLLSLPKEKAVPFEPFANQVIEDVGLVWTSQDERFVQMMKCGIVERLLIDPMTRFGVLECGYRVMIGEIQYLENPSSFLKLLADHHRYLKVIVSGSSRFEVKSKFKDSLVGRTVNFEVYPLSFEEFLGFKGVPFQPAPHYTEKKTAELQSLYTEFSLYGGYPKIVLTDDVSIKERYLQQIIDTYIRKDIRDLADIKDVWTNSTAWLKSWPCKVRLLKVTRPCFVNLPLQVHRSEWAA